MWLLNSDGNDVVEKTSHIQSSQDLLKVTVRVNMYSCTDSFYVAEEINVDNPFTFTLPYTTLLFHCFYTMTIKNLRIVKV